MRKVQGTANARSRRRRHRRELDAELTHPHTEDALFAVFPVSPTKVLSRLQTHRKVTAPAARQSSGRTPTTPVRCRRTSLKVVRRPTALGSVSKRAGRPHHLPTLGKPGKSSIPSSGCAPRHAHGLELHRIKWVD